MEKLGINPIQLVAQLVNFGIILFVLKKFLYKPVLSLLEKRKQTIVENIKLKDDLEKELAKLADKEANSAKKSKSDATKIANEARKEGQNSAEKIIEKARLEAKEIILQAKLTAISQVEKGKKELDTRVEQRALALANQVLAKMLPKEIKAKITEAQVKKLTQTDDK